MKSHRGPPQSSPAQMKIPSGCGFLLLKTATLLLLFTHRFSRGATLQICTKKSSRRSSPARLVELFPHLEGTNTNSVRLFQLSARPHSLSRFGVLPREKVCIGFALNVPEKKKKKKENGSPFFPSPAGRNFLRTRVQKCKQKLWTVQRRHLALKLEHPRMFCWNKRCYPRFFFLPSPLQRPRQTNKTKGRLLFCSPLPACHHIHLCCFVSSKCLPLSLRRPAKRPARACAAFQTGKQDRGGGGGGDGELKAGHFDWLSSLVSGQRCIVGWSPGGGSENAFFS